MEEVRDGAVAAAEQAGVSQEAVAAIRAAEDYKGLESAWKAADGERIASKRSSMAAAVRSGGLGEDLAKRFEAAETADDLAAAMKERFALLRDREADDLESKGRKEDARRLRAAKNEAEYAEALDENRLDGFRRAADDMEADGYLQAEVKGIRTAKTDEEAVKAGKTARFSRSRRVLAEAVSKAPGASAERLASILAVKDAKELEEERFRAFREFALPDLLKVSGLPEDLPVEEDAGGFDSMRVDLAQSIAEEIQAPASGLPSYMAEAILSGDGELAAYFGTLRGLRLEEWRQAVADNMSAWAGTPESAALLELVRSAKTEKDLADVVRKAESVRKQAEKSGLAGASASLATDAAGAEDRAAAIVEAMAQGRMTSREAISRLGGAGKPLPGIPEDPLPPLEDNPLWKKLAQPDFSGMAEKIARLPNPSIEKVGWLNEAREMIGLPELSAEAEKEFVQADSRGLLTARSVAAAIRMEEKARKKASAAGKAPVGQDKTEEADEDEPEAPEIRRRRMAEEIASASASPAEIAGRLDEARSGAGLPAMPAAERSGVLQAIRDGTFTADDAERILSGAEEESASGREQRRGLFTVPVSRRGRPAEDAAAPRADEKTGDRVELRTPQGNMRVSGRLRVVDLFDDVATSYDGDYEVKELQNRGLDGLTIDDPEPRVDKIVKEFDHRELLSSTTSESGPPVLKRIGKKLNVLSGNGRTKALRKLHRQGRLGEYVAAVRAETARRGIEIPESVEVPMLAVELEDGVDLHKFVYLSNKDKIDGFNAYEKALNDADVILREGLLDKFAPGESGDVLTEENRDFWVSFIDAVGERKQLLDSDNRPDDSLEPRIRRAILAALFKGRAGGRETVQALVERSRDLGAKAQITAILSAAGPVLKVAKEKPAFSIADDFAEAVEMFLDYKANEGAKIRKKADAARAAEKYLASPRMFQKERGAVAKTIFRILATSPGIGAIRERFSAYAQSVAAIDVTTEDLFGSNDAASSAARDRSEKIRRLQDALGVQVKEDGAEKAARPFLRPMSQRREAAETFRVVRALPRSTTVRWPDGSVVHYAMNRADALDAARADWADEKRRQADYAARPTAAQGEAMAERLKDALASGERLNFAGDVSDLPDKVRRKVEREANFGKSTKAFTLPDGSVWILAKRHRDLKDLAESILHEDLESIMMRMAGSAGFARRMDEAFAAAGLTAAYNAELRNVVVSYGYVEDAEIVRAAREREDGWEDAVSGWLAGHADARFEVMRELLATVRQRRAAAAAKTAKADKGMWDAVLEAVRKFLSEIFGVDFAAGDLARTVPEIERLIDELAEGGPRAKPKADGTLFRNEENLFGKKAENDGEGKPTYTPFVRRLVRHKDKRYSVEVKFADTKGNLLSHSFGPEVELFQAEKKFRAWADLVSGIDYTESGTHSKADESKFRNEEWEQSISEWKDGKMDESRTLTVLRSTPEILVRCGAENRAITISKSALDKSTKKKHAVSIDDVRGLPSALEDPVAVLQSETEPDSLVVLTEFLEGDKKVLVAIRLDRRESRHVVNSIRSIYGKDAFAIQGFLMRGRGLYVNQKKTRALLQSRGLQLPKEATKRGNRNILTETDIQPRSAGNIARSDGNVNGTKYRNEEDAATQIRELYVPASKRLAKPVAGAKEKPYDSNRERIRAAEGKNVRVREGGDRGWVSGRDESRPLLPIPVSKRTRPVPFSETEEYHRIFRWKRAQMAALRSSDPAEIGKFLTHDHPKVRGAAALNPSAGSENLLRALGDADEDVRLAAASNVNAAEPVLEKAAKDPNEHVRFAAAFHPNATDAVVAAASSGTNWKEIAELRSREYTAREKVRHLFRYDKLDDAEWMSRFDEAKAKHALALSMRIRAEKDELSNGVERLERETALRTYAFRFHNEAEEDPALSAVPEKESAEEKAAKLEARWVGKIAGERDNLAESVRRHARILKKVWPAPGRRTDFDSAQSALEAELRKLKAAPERRRAVRELIAGLKHKDSSELKTAVLDVLKEFDSISGFDPAVSAAAYEMFSDREWVGEVLSAMADGEATEAEAAAAAKKLKWAAPIYRKGVKAGWEAAEKDNLHAFFLARYKKHKKANVAYDVNARLLADWGALASGMEGVRAAAKDETRSKRARAALRTVLGPEGMERVAGLAERDPVEALRMAMTVVRALVFEVHAGRILDVMGSRMLLSRRDVSYFAANPAPRLEDVSFNNLNPSVKPELRALLEKLPWQAIFSQKAFEDAEGRARDLGGEYDGKKIERIRALRAKQRQKILDWLEGIEPIELVSVQFKLKGLLEESLVAQAAVLAGARKELHETAAAVEREAQDALPEIPGQEKYRARAMGGWFGFKRLTALHSTPETLALMIGGGDVSSAAYKALYLDVLAARDAAAESFMRQMKSMEDWYAKNGITEELRASWRSQTKEWTFKLQGADLAAEPVVLKFNLTPAELMDLAAHLQDDETQVDVARGARLGPIRQKTTSNAPKLPSGEYFQAFRKAVAEALTPQQRKVVGRMVSAVSAMGPQVNAMSMRLEGREIAYSARHWERKRDMGGADPDAQLGVSKKPLDGGGLLATSKQTKERVANRRGIFLRDVFDHFDRQVKWASAYAHFALAQKTVNDVLTYRRETPATEERAAEVLDLNDVLSRRIGEDNVKALAFAGDRIAGDARLDDGWKVRKFIGGLYRNVSGAKLAIRPSSILNNAIGGSLMLASRMGMIDGLSGADYWAARARVTAPTAPADKELKAIKAAILDDPYFWKRLVWNRFAVQTQHLYEGEYEHSKKRLSSKMEKWMNKALAGMSAQELHNAMACVLALQKKGWSVPKAIQWTKRATELTQNPSDPLDETNAYVWVKKSGTDMLLPFFGQLSVEAGLLRREGVILAGTSKMLSAAKRKAAVARQKMDKAAEKIAAEEVERLRKKTKTQVRNFRKTAAAISASAAYTAIQNAAIYYLKRGAIPLVGVGFWQFVLKSIGRDLLSRVSPLAESYLLPQAKTFWNIVRKLVDGKKLYKEDFGVPDVIVLQTVDRLLRAANEIRFEDPVKGAIDLSGPASELLGLPMGGAEQIGGVGYGVMRAAQEGWTTDIRTPVSMRARADRD